MMAQAARPLILALAAVAAAGPAAAQVVPPIAESWYIGEPAASPDPRPTHFAFGPNPPTETTSLVARARFLPNVLAALTADVTSPVDPQLVYRAGSQWFQLARQPKPTFCSFEALERFRHHCLIDSDADGLLDTMTTAHSRVPAVPLLQIEGRRLTPLPRPVAIRLLPREQVTQELTISLQYIGRRLMTRRDATFMIQITDGTAFATGLPLPLFLDALPPEVVLAGVRLTNLVRRGKIIEFDVPEGFRSRLFDPYYGGRYVEWGF